VLEGEAAKKGIIPSIEMIHGFLDAFHYPPSLQQALKHGTDCLAHKIRCILIEDAVVVQELDRMYSTGMSTVSTHLSVPKHTSTDSSARATSRI
jgi:hypothetical protein